jgi:hypothetical protein
VDQELRHYNWDLLSQSLPINFVAHPPLLESDKRRERERERMSEEKERR